MPRKILVAMSGGVDSSVTAALLQEQGHEVAGATIRTWASNQCAYRNTRACCGLTGVEDARRVSERLGIPYWVFNFEKDFKRHVVDYFASEYLKGRTPNPCIACNEHIKFRLFLRRARQLGYEAIATGHYAQIHQDEKTGNFYLSEAVDAGKDQSYVLFPLSQEILRHLFLPLGHYTKAQVRDKARALGLCVMDKPDSQEICFIPSNDYGSFLEREYLHSLEKGELRLAKKGKVLMRDGQVLGEHSGFYHYTRGQRRGLGIPFRERLYVLKTLPQTNTVIVGSKQDVLSHRCRVERVNWFLHPPLSTSVRAHVKIRSQHTKAPAVLTLVNSQTVHVEFDQPQEAITPGQAAVFYDGSRVLGGGWIADTDMP